MNVALVDFEREYDGKVLRLVAVAIRSPTATSYTDGFPRGTDKGMKASQFRSTMRIVPAVPAAKCCAGGVPVWSRGGRQVRQRRLRQPPPCLEGATLASESVLAPGEKMTRFTWSLAVSR